jgi:predicted homoserine dehydrogenase-like protein
MNLYTKLAALDATNKPLRVGLIGAGKFGSMYLSRVRGTPGVHLVAVADLAPENAKANMIKVGWPHDALQAENAEAAIKHGSTWVSDDVVAMIATPGIDIIIDATGHPVAGVDHVQLCCEHQKHIVMVNVEADALAGPYLAKLAADAGIIYSLAYGDQPALITEMVDWARAAGFEVIAAGKGTKYLTHFHHSTPDTVWQHYGLTPEAAAKGGMNPQMFNSFLDGTKSALEMVAVANACNLSAPANGLKFPACGVDDLANVLRPESDGGILDTRGEVEVVASLERDGRPVFRDLRWGVYITFAADSDYVKRCFSEYGLVTDDSGNYSAMYKPFHLIGLELGISVASVGVRGEATGQPSVWNADAVCVAKRDIKQGEILDGEGGYLVYGQLMPATQSIKQKALPMGLAQGIAMKQSVKAGQILSMHDVLLDDNNSGVRAREAMRTM